SPPSPTRRSCDLLTYGTQHILTMYGGVIAPPLIIGEAAGLSGSEMGLLITAGLFISGLATILQALGIGPFGSRLPLVQGISFASVSTLASIGSDGGIDRKSTRLNSSHVSISYAVFCLKKKTTHRTTSRPRTRA